MQHQNDGAQDQSAKSEELRMRFLTTGDKRDIAAAAQLGRQALAAVRDTSLHGVLAFRLATVLATQYEATGELAVLDEAGRHLQTAMEDVPAEHQDFPQVLMNAAMIRLRRFHRTGDLAHLEATINQARRGAQLYPHDDPRRPGAHSNLAGALRRRYEITGLLADLDEAISLSRAVIGSGRDVHQPLMLASLAGSLNARFRATGDKSDLAEAITHGQAAERAAPPGNPARRSVLSILSHTYGLQFDRTGSLDALNQSVDCQRELVGMIPDAHPEAVIVYLGLAGTLRMRFERVGVAHDLDQAITAARHGYDVAREDLACRQAAANLAMLLPLQATQRQAASDLPGAIDSCDEALALTERALANVPAQHLERPDLLAIQGNVWMTRYQLSQDADDARAGVRAHQDALDASAPGNRHRGLMLSNLGYALLQASPDPTADELGRAISALREAVHSSKANEALWAQAASNLTVALVRRYERSRAEADRTEALTLAREVGDAPGAATGQRAAVSAIGAELSMLADDPLLAASFYRKAVQLLPATAWIGVDRTTQQSSLVRVSASDISRDAAACLLITGSSEGVIEQLEGGRGILWTQLLQRRHHDASLEHSHPHIAARLRELAAELNALPDQSLTG
jgi:hypothetical protein